MPCHDQPNPGVVEVMDSSNGTINAIGLQCRLQPGHDSNYDVVVQPMRTPEFCAVDECGVISVGVYWWLDHHRSLCPQRRSQVRKLACTDDERWIPRQPPLHDNPIKSRDERHAKPKMRSIE